MKTETLKTFINRLSDDTPVRVISHGEQYKICSLGRDSEGAFIGIATQKEIEKVKKRIEKSKEARHD